MLLKNAGMHQLFFRIQILLDHHLKSLENLNNSYNTKKTTLFLNFNQSEENCFEKVLEKKIFKARKQFEKKHEKKIYHIRTPTDTEQSSQSTQSDSQGTQSSIDVSLTDNTTVINEEILLQEDINTAQVLDEASDSVKNNTNNENNNAYHNNNEDVNNENNNENNNLENNNEDNNNTYKVKDRRWLPKRQFRKMNKEN